MIATLNIQNTTLQFNLDAPIDISIPLSSSANNPTAWYLDPPTIAPVKVDNWVGKVALGASTNFNTITFNPHAHGTHTECVGHITAPFVSINQVLQRFWYIAQLITLTPECIEDDYCITLPQLQKSLQDKLPLTEALVIRTYPNPESKKSAQYSHTNPPYLTSEAVEYLITQNITHLLVDLPSIDKEKDEGKLLAHKAFWNITDVTSLDSDTRIEATITEMIYVPNTAADGNYLLNMQIASFENDATPSKPILYEILCLGS